MDEAALSDASSDGIPRRDRLSFFLINQRRLINLLLWEAVIDLEKNRDFPLNGIIGETIESTSPFEHNVKLFATPTIPIPINPLFFKSSYRTRQERLPSIPRKEIALLFLNEKSSSTFLLNFIQKDIRAGSSLLFLSFSPRSKQAELSEFERNSFNSERTLRGSSNCALFAIKRIHVGIEKSCKR